MRRDEQEIRAESRRAVSDSAHRRRSGAICRLSHDDIPRTCRTSLDPGPRRPHVVASGDLRSCDGRVRRLTKWLSARWIGGSAAVPKRGPRRVLPRVGHSSLPTIRGLTFRRTTRAPCEHTSALFWTSEIPERSCGSCEVVSLGSEFHCQSREPGRPGEEQLRTLHFPPGNTMDTWFRAGCGPNQKLLLFEPDRAVLKAELNGMRRCDELCIFSQIEWRLPLT